MALPVDDVVRDLGSFKIWTRALSFPTRNLRLPAFAGIGRQSLDAVPILDGILSCLKEPAMRPTTTVSCLVAVSLVVAACVASSSPALAAGTKTSKERLSD